MKDISFDDLIPARANQTRRQQAMDISFDDLIPEKKEISKTESAARGTLQGATFATSDDIYGGLRSLTRDISRGIENKLYGDNMLSPISYEQARQESDLANKTAREANPGSYIAGEIAGALGTGAAGATTKTGAAIGNFVRGRPLAPEAGAVARISRPIVQGVKSAIVAVPGGALYGAGAAEPGQRIEGARTGAEYAGAFGAVSPILGSAASRVLKDTGAAFKGVFAKSVDEIDNIVSKYGLSANKYYTAMRDEGASIAPHKTQELFTSIDDTLRKRGILNPALHGKTIAVLGDLKNAAKNGELDLETLDQQRRILSRIRPGIEGGEDAGMARAAVKVINEIEDSITNKDLTKGSVDAVNNLKLGRAEARKQIKIDEIGDMIRKSDGDPNRLKANFAAFVKEKDNLNSFSADEQKALYEAARNTVPEKLLKMAGKFGIDLGSSFTPGNTFLPVASGYVNPAVPVAGTAARLLQTYMARGKADQVIQAIQKGKIPKEIYQLPPKEAKQVLSLLGKSNAPLSQQIAPNYVGENKQ